MKFYLHPIGECAGGLPRNPAGEIARCFFMLGICFLHASTFGAYNEAWWANCFYLCVDGFVLISGWYGIKFSWRKFAVLWGIALTCAVINAIIYDLFIRGCGAVEFCLVVKQKAFSNWYLNCYAILMMLAPLINEGIDCLVKSRERVFAALQPFFLLVFGWSWLSEKTARWFELPMASGLGSYSFLTLMGVYVVGRICRAYQVDQKPIWLFVTLWIVGTILCVCGLGWYASPFTVVGAIGLFFLIMKIRWPKWIGEMALFVAPSVFSIYCLSQGVEGRCFVRMMDMQGIWGFLLIGISIFSLGIVMDVSFRRLPRKIIRVLIHRIRFCAQDGIV